MMAALICTLTFGPKQSRDIVPMIVELCHGIIVLKAAAMLHVTDAKFAIIDSAHEAKSSCTYGGTSNDTKKYRGTCNGMLVHRIAHLC